MNKLLKKQTQDKLYNYIRPILVDSLEKEYRKRDEIIQKKEEQEKFLEDPEVIEYKKRKENDLQLIEKLVSLYESLEEDLKQRVEAVILLPRFEIKDYLDNKTLFVEKYNKEVEERVDRILLDLTSSHYGVSRSRWALKTDLDKELKARLSVQPVATFNEVVDKVIKDINIENFFNNK